MAERRIRWGVISTANIGRAAVIPAIQASRTLKVNWNSGAPLSAQATLQQSLTDPSNIYQTSMEDVVGNVDEEVEPVT